MGRDKTSDQPRFYGVTTTRIYCRPGCPSRRPKPEHVVWFASPDDAEKAGFRACKRCRPGEEKGPA